MSQNKRHNNRRKRTERRFTVRGVRRNPADIGKLSRALLLLAQAEAERQARAEHARHTNEEVISDQSAQQEGGALDA